MAARTYRGIPIPACITPAVLRTAISGLVNKRYGSGYSCHAIAQATFELMQRRPTTSFHSWDSDESAMAADEWCQFLRDLQLIPAGGNTFKTDSAPQWFRRIGRTNATRRIALMTQVLDVLEQDGVWVGRYELDWQYPSVPDAD